MGWRPSTWQAHPTHVCDGLCTLQSMWPKSPQTKDCTTWPSKGAGFPYFWFKRKRLPCESLHAAGNHHTHYKQKGLESDFYMETCISSVQLLSRVQLFATPQSANARPPCPSPTPGVYPNSCPLSWWYHPTMSSPSPPAFNLSQHHGLFQWVSSSYQVDKGLEFQLQHQSFQWTPRNDLL